MEKRNRFSTLLESLMTTANIKNYTLARQLQYDVSYISKWVSGRMLPAEKTSDKILHGISHCIVSSVPDKNRSTLYLDYQVSEPSDLEQAIYDNLEAEYNYVKGLTKTLGTDIAPQTLHFAELTLPQFIGKMKHPALRKVNSLDVVAAIDILSLEHEYRLMISQIESESPELTRDFPEVHFSMLLNLEIGERDYIYDVIFLINMLTNYTHIDFQLYGGMQAYGKIVFSVKNAYSITGMLFDTNQCLQVTISEEPKVYKTLYHKFKSLCSRELLLFRKVSMKDLVKNNDYIHHMLSPNLRWLIGRMTEHFLPDDLFEEIMNQAYDPNEWTMSIEDLRGIHKLTTGVLEESPIRIMIYESAFTEFAVSGELDFYNHPVILTTDQRQRYIQHIVSLVSLAKNSNTIDLKLIQGQFVTDFQYVANPCLFLSNELCYLRLDSETYQNNVSVLNGVPIKEMFYNFYEQIWDYSDDVVISDTKTIQDILDHILQSIHLLSRMQ